jgi:short-subunit dehydrogenase
MSRGLRRELAFLAGAGSLALLAKRERGFAALLGLGALALAAFPGGYSFRNRAVVITGGSRGLGLALGEEFLRAGARVALLARDSDELDQARALLQERVTGGEVITLTCDVTQRAELARSFEQVQGVFGEIDILVNNAGAITVGPFETMDRDDFAGVLELQVHSIVNAVQVLLPQLRSGRGRVVNICSIGGKVPVPHMSSYCAAKFALAGLSASLHAELGAQGVAVTTVFPGLMRTGSVIQAVVKGDHEKEFAWFAAGDSIPILSVSARYAARRILAGIRDGDAEVVFPATSRLAELARANFPELFAFALREAARFFPQGTSTERQTGAESRNWLHAQPWFGPLRLMSEKAQKDYNQTERFDPDFNLGL